MRATSLAGLVALVLAAGAKGDTRTFQVSVDGKPAGQYRVAVTEADGATRCAVTARVEVKHLLGTYRYSLDSQEVWKGGKLVGLRSVANDDGTKHDVSLTGDGTTATLTADRKATRGSAAVWPTTYWRLPPAPGGLTLLDSDTGKLIRGRLERVGAEKVRVLGTDQTATRYRLTGGVDVTLWYDAGGRLVRETFVEDGHRTTLELIEQIDK